MRSKMLIKNSFFIRLALSLAIAVCSKASAHTATNYLSPPSGKYAVSYEDLHLINDRICPDPNSQGKKENFLSLNKKFCHEIQVRLYYPTLSKAKHRNYYYAPFIKDLKLKIEAITHKQSTSISEIKSYTSKNEPIVSGQKFPVIFFTPGLGCPSQMYENMITELVSHGYIVFAINSLFINGDIENPNQQIVKAVAPRSTNEIEKVLIPIQLKDLAFCVDSIGAWRNKTTIFNSMDLTKVGALGHSIGGRNVISFAKTHPRKLKAAATLDSSIDPDSKSIAKSSIPFLHEIAANKQTSSPFPIKYELGSNAYLVLMSPNNNNHDYSYHLNFTDFSTLQYDPDIHVFLKALEKKTRQNFNVVIDPNGKLNKDFAGETYLLTKNNGNWLLAYYMNDTKIMNFQTNDIGGLSEFVNSLPKDFEVAKQKQNSRLKNIVTSFRAQTSELVGTGNGWALTNSINTYLLSFFDVYLKGMSEQPSIECKPLTPDTKIKCGPSSA